MNKEKFIKVKKKDFLIPIEINNIIGIGKNFAEKYNYKLLKNFNDKNKNILAITLARGGSKAVPNKNIKKILGKPLIAFTIEEVLKSKYIDDYIVSTDSKKIANVAKKFGAKVPFLRPKNISRDNSAAQDALVHALNKYESMINKKFDYIVEIMCTNPLKNFKDIDLCIEKIHRTKSDTVISVQRLYDHHPIRIKKIKNDRIFNFILPENERTRRETKREKHKTRNRNSKIR